MRELESLKKLREFTAKNAGYREIAKNEFTSYLTSAEMNELKNIADAIQAEVDERYMPLLLDADGVPWTTTDNRTTELLPCPWCGVDMKLHPINYPWADGEPGWKIWHEDMGEACRRKCPIEMGCYDTREEAIATWNTRTEQVVAATLGAQADYRGLDRLRGIAEDMRNIGASSMTPHELFAYWSGEIEKAIGLLKRELNVTLGAGECEAIIEPWDYGVGFDAYCGNCGHNVKASPTSLRNHCPKCGVAIADELNAKLRIKEGGDD